MHITTKPSLLSDMFTGNFNSLVNDILNEDVARDITIRPAIEIRENDKSYFVDVVLPGLKKEDIEISLENNILKIEGERKSLESSEGMKTRLSEVRYGKYARRIELPKDVSTKAIDAHFENGMLHIDLPKSEEAKPRSITIK